MGRAMGQGKGKERGEITAALRLQFSPVSLKSHLRAPLALCPSGRLKGQAP